MARPSKLSPERRAELEERIRSRQATQEALSVEFGLSTITISKIAKRLGVMGGTRPRRHQGVGVT